MSGYREREKVPSMTHQNGEGIPDEEVVSTPSLSSPENRLERIRRAVASGSYRVPGEDVAEKIIHRYLRSK